MEASGWILAVLALAAGGWMLTWFSRHWAHLEQLVNDMAAGRRPDSHVFLGSRRFAKIAGQLEKIGKEQEELGRRIEMERWNQEALLTSMIEGVMVVDHSHVIRLVNRSLLELFGLTVSPLRSSVLSALREASIEQIITEAFRAGTAQTSEVSVRPRTRGALMRHCAISAVPLRDHAGADAGVVVVFHDITRLRGLEEIRREFVANVSHELRTPLSIFQGYLENLLDNPEMPGDELAGIFAVMKRHSVRLNALLEDLLTLARLESRNEVLELAPIDIAEFLSRLVRDWQPKFQKERLTVEIQTASELPALHADAARLEQVFSNLLENATKFTPPGGKIKLCAQAEAEEFVMRISDSGIGIPPADLPHIFERFYRVEKARSRDSGGTGLGLSIVKHIVSLHNGSVSAGNAPEGGTVITIRLPLNAD